MPSDKTYTIAAGVWPRSPKLTIESTVGTRIARIPLNFLETSGDNTWSFVSYIVSLLVVPDPAHRGSIIDSSSGLSVDPDGVPQAGTFRFIEQGVTTTSTPK
jgi:hypothetical protein